MIGVSGTKYKILYLLKKNQRLSAASLSASLAMTEMGVRKHLRPLIKEGLIEVDICKRPVGRPVQIFLLSDRAEDAFPKNYGELTLQFLRDIDELYGGQAVERLFHRRKIRLIGKYETELGKSNAAESRLKRFNALQTAYGYMSRIHKIDDRTYELIEYNCPILEVARQYRTACSRETELIKEVLDADHVRRTLCRSEGGAYCRFLITWQNK